MPPTPNSGEKRSSFIGRCVGSKEMKKEFSDVKQRVAVCYSKWKKHTKGEVSDFDEKLTQEIYDQLDVE